MMENVLLRMIQMDLDGISNCYMMMMMVSSNFVLRS